MTVKLLLLSDNGKEILSMNEVMYYLLVNSKPLIEELKLKDLRSMPQFKWQNFADEVKGLQFFMSPIIIS
jgi:ribonuclease-3